MLHQSPSEKEEKKKKQSSFFQWFQTLNQAPHAESFCTADQCFRPPAAATSFSNPQTSFTYFETDTIHDLQEDKPNNSSYSLADLLPPDYYEAMKEAAKSGFLYSFLASTSVELFSDYLNSKRFTSDQIYYAKQAIRSLTILAFSAYLGSLDIKSFCIIVGSPLISFTLDKGFGINKTLAQVLPVGALVTTQILSDLSNVPKTLLTLGSGIGTGWLGQETVQKISHFARNNLFALNNSVESAEEKTQTLQPRKGLS